MAPFHGLGPLVGGGQHSAVAKYFLADMRGLVGGIDHNDLYFRIGFGHTVIHFIKSHAVIYIPGGNDSPQDEVMLVTGDMGLIGKLRLVFSLHKQAAVRIRHASGCRAQLLLFPPGQLLL